MFFSEEKTQDPFMELAKKLYDIAKAAKVRWLKITVLPGWRTSMRKLCKSVSVEKVNEVLDWYAENHSREFVPKALNAAAFRDKFPQIVKAMDNCDEHLVIEERYQYMAGRLMLEYEFPVEISARLPILAQKTSDAWKSFCEKLKVQQVSDREHGFVTKILDHVSPTFVWDWLVFLSKKFGYLDHYCSPQHTLVFSPTSPWFEESFWHKWSQDWCATASAFDPLLARLNKKE